MDDGREKFDIKRSIGAPVMVNLITALLLVSCAMLLKRPLIRFFSENEAYPLYCVAEPYANPERPEQMSVEVFIINLTGKIWTEEALDSFVRDSAGGGVRKAGLAEIQLVANKGVELSNVVAATGFNEQKGDLNIRAGADKSSWTIVVDEIQPNAILKVDVATSRPMGRWSRNDHSAVPFKIRYPGVKAAGS